LKDFSKNQIEGSVGQPGIRCDVPSLSRTDPSTRSCTGGGGGQDDGCGCRSVEPIFDCKSDSILINFDSCGETLFSSFPLANSLISILKTFEVLFQPETVPFKGPQPCHVLCFMNLRDTRTLSGTVCPKLFGTPKMYQNEPKMSNYCAQLPPHTGLYIHG